MRFEWDAPKATRNIRKHGVSFEEASSVFEDHLSVTGADPDHSRGEMRWLTIGMSSRGRVLVVAHADEGDIVRIISARSATRLERQLYEQG